MSYSEWLELIELLKKSSKKEYMEKFLAEPVNNNLLENLKPKIIDMIYQRFNNSVNHIVGSLDEIWDDEYALDMELVNFRKSNLITFDLINNNYLDEEEQKELKKRIFEEISKVYKILKNEAIMFDDNGIALEIINNNEIKRDDNNEL